MFLEITPDELEYRDVNTELKYHFLGMFLFMVIVVYDASIYIHE